MAAKSHKLSELQIKVILSMQNGNKIMYSKGLRARVDTYHKNVFISFPTFFKLEEAGYIERDPSRDEDWRFDIYVLTEKGKNYKQNDSSRIS